MSTVAPAPNLTGGRLLARNTIWNLLGFVLPMAVGVVTVPPLVRGLGVARFGILSLAWIVIGYFSLFDLGLGRAITKLVADKLAANDKDSVPSLAWTSLVLMVSLGGLGGLLTLAISPWLVQSALKIPGELRQETVHSFYLLALSIPVVTTTSGLRGVLEALQRFRILNLIRIPMSAFSFLGPLMVLPFSRSLLAVVVTLVIARVIACGAHLLACFQALPELRRNVAPDRSMIVPLLRFGGWMTLVNLVGPLIVYSDRFVISALFSVAVVSYYTVPFDLVTRLIVIPSATSGVLFPAFALSATQDLNRTRVLLRRGLKYVFLAVFPVTLVLVTLSHEALQLWLGTSFADNSWPALRWLSVGVFVNCLSMIPFALLQGLGRPDVAGKLLLFELPISITAMWLLTARFGIAGAAVAWASRATLETAIVLFLSHRFLGDRIRLRRLAVGVIAAGAAFYVGSIAAGFLFKCVFLACSLLVFAVVAWFVALEPEERYFLARSSPLLGAERSRIAP